MVVPIRELANIQLSTTISITQMLQMANLPSNMNMDVNTDIIRERSTLLSLIHGLL